MPPKKTTETEPAEPRRSGRIASISKPAPTVPEARPKVPKAPKKRAAEEETTEKDEGSTTKKSKADEAAMDVDTTAGSSTQAASLASIDIGDSLPSLILKNEKDADIQVEHLAKEKGVILFLVPKADTPGCTSQACGFRDSYPDFTSLNYDVYCLSADTPTAQTKWQTKKELPYPLISDPQRVLITALGAAEGGKTKRSHFIFEKGGKLVDKKVPVKPADSPRLALEYIKGQK
ncbi:thioredoxin-like protein [Crepidotus variabilis]|uniref:thioredoxin-dependent peroxiredoxin n=1 Tax=Crepidotus variabilis TaxID=179855 RepID=A0A9P6EMB7_9AGAR|nr:thioredoxin-like protein [Crepidotus variabilis]